MEAKAVVFLTATPIWSLNNKVGAPSCFNTIQGYANRGWQVYLITPNRVEDNVFTNVRVICDSKRENGGKSKAGNKVSMFLENVKNSNGIDRFLYAKGDQLLNGLDRKGVLVYAYEVHAVHAGKRLAQKYHLPLVTRFQGTIMYNKKDNIVNRVGYYPHYQALKTQSDLVIMTNDGTCGDKYLKQIGNRSEMLFLRNGVDIAQNHEGLRPREDVLKQLGLTGDEQILMTLSRLVNWKRVDRSITALSHIVKVKPNVKLVVIGDGDAKPGLMALAERLNLNDSVIFTGSIPQKEVASYLQMADVFLSLYDLGNAGNPTFEAMKCGRAIVALNNGNTKEVLTNGETAVLLEPTQTDEIPGVVIHLLEDDGLRGRLGNSARRYADENFYSWETRIDMECERTGKLVGAAR